MKPISFSCHARTNKTRRHCRAGPVFKAMAHHQELSPPLAFLVTSINEWWNFEVVNGKRM